jgi:hypothetical protein
MPKVVQYLRLHGRQDSRRVVSECPDVFPEDLPEEGRRVDGDIPGSLC